MWLIVKLNTLIAFVMGTLTKFCMDSTIQNPFFKNTAFPHSKNSDILILNLASSLNMVIETIDVFTDWINSVINLNFGLMNAIGQGGRSLSGSGIVYEYV